ncbi:MAG: hypothetical protein LBK18_03135 [Prevotellaceae bacterium]|jgi:hypothetical protein|nr:hypothetical protein [Prevotellaceae bacterium]
MIFCIKKSCLLFLLVACVPLFALTRQEFTQRERELRLAIRDIAKTGDSTQKLALNGAFAAQLEQTLRQDSAFFYAFDSIPYLYKVASTDGLVRVITWNVPVPGRQEYFGFVLLRGNADAVHATLHVLRDKRMHTKLVEGRALGVDEWFGALYTKLIDKQHPRTGKPAYTLVGVSPGNNGISNKKVIDVLNVDSGGLCTFGAPVFVKKTRVTYRMIFEYSVEAVMELRYHDGTEQIIFSNLVPMYSQLRGRYETYIPNDAYDAFRFENGRWIFYENIEPPSSATVRRWQRGSRSR